MKLFSLTFWCLCSLCTGRWHGLPTSTGEPALPFFTIACEPSLTRERWIVLVEGEGIRKCSTVGGGIKKGEMDLLVGTHQEALKRGRVKRRVWFLWRGALLKGR